MLPYTIHEIQQRITPIAQKYQLAAVCLFGSCARGEATAESDVDLLIDLTGSVIHGLNYVSLYYDLQDALQTSVDIVTADTLDLSHPPVKVKYTSTKLSEEGKSSMKLRDTQGCDRPSQNAKEEHYATYRKHWRTGFCKTEKQKLFFN